MKRICMIALLGGLLSAPVFGAVLFQDSFDTGVSGAKWEAMPGSTYYQQLIGDSSHVRGVSGQAARQEMADPWIYYSRTTSSAVTAPGLVGAGQKELLTVWMWDDNVQSGAQTAGAIMLSDAGGSDFYQLQVNSTRSWTSFVWRTSIQGTFVSTFPRSQGWHKLQIEVLPFTGANDVNFYIDGTQIATGNRKANNEMNQIRLGISIKTPGSPFWYDDVELSMVPEPASALMLVLGCCGLVLRRRR
jgi:hypothetical protein